MNNDILSISDFKVFNDILSVSKVLNDILSVSTGQCPVELFGRE